MSSQLNIRVRKTSRTVGRSRTPTNGWEFLIGT